MTIPKRTAIRKAVADKIRSLFVKAFPYRASAINPDHFPCAFVYIETGKAEQGNDGVEENQSVLEIEIFMQGVGDLEAELDLKEVDVNDLLENDPTVGGVLDGIIPVGFAYDRVPEAATTSLTLTYQILYDEE